jgi:hypothetical protein
MLQQIRQQFEKTFSKELLDKLFESYQLASEHYYLGRYRPACQEGGRFAEASLRMLQQVVDGTYIPLGKQISNFRDIVIHFENADKNTFSDAIRFHIPRTLQVIYDIRNKRDVGHIGGDVDANFSDATLSVVSCNWVMTEFLRIYYISDIRTAQELVNSLIRIRIPLIQDFNGFLKILKPDLSLPSRILALLYYCGSQGATITELNQWLGKRIQTGNMNTTLYRLEHEKAYIHREKDRCFITDSGKKYVEENIPFQI